MSPGLVPCYATVDSKPYGRAASTQTRRKPGLNRTRDDKVIVEDKLSQDDIVLQATSPLSSEEIETSRKLLFGVYSSNHIDRAITQSFESNFTMFLFCDIDDLLPFCFLLMFKHCWKESMR